jgi:hemolysin-activating ACP:hemolysin acyltransferase
MTDTIQGLALAPEQDPNEIAVDPEALITVGEMIRIASQSLQHRDYSLAQFERRFLIPASLGQFRV